MFDNKNLIAAIVLSVAILLGFQLIYGVPTQEYKEKQEISETEKNESLTPNIPKNTIIEKSNKKEISVEKILDRKTIISRSPRIRIQSNVLSGSVNLRGALIDDLTLLAYGNSIDKSSDRVVFLAPRKSPNPYVVSFGWTQESEENCRKRSNDSSDCENIGKVELPSENSVWTSDHPTLTPEKPITLTWDNGNGLTFFQRIELDEYYMFKITQGIKNKTNNLLTLYPYGQIIRDGAPETLGFFILHEGPIGVFDNILEQIDYDDIVEEGERNQSINFNPKNAGGWIGITDKYWLTALIPDNKSRSEFRYLHRQSQRYCADEKSNLINVVPTKQKGPCGAFVLEHVGDQVVIKPNQTKEFSEHFFAGAKVVRLLDNYGSTLNIPRFDRAVDFGLLFFLTKPIFLALRFISEMIGNFGIAILLLTVLIKLLFFPLANRSYRAMSKMKLLAPEMKKLRERYKNDRQKQQQEIMALYRKEGANPISGCLPVLIQIPIFFALYKVLFVTIEMRHSPFFGWIQDLSAPDPLNLFTLFGLIPWAPPSFIPVLGIWPLLMGFSMWLQMRLNPQPMDPMQARIFMLMPIFFTFLLASFPAGLVIYWTWNNILSIAQQWAIMRRAGVKNPAAVD